jgi:hypothetical protein
MPVDLTNIGRERTVAGLVKTLVGSKSEAELRDRVEQALLQANPGLGSDGLQPGAPIIVPDLTDKRGESPEKAAGPSEDSMRVLGPAIDALAGQVGAQLDAALKDAAESAKSLKSKAVIDAITAARPDLKDALPTIAAEAEQEVKRVEETASKLRAAVGRIQEQVSSLRPR